MLKAGTQVGSFEVLSRLGADGMGEVKLDFKGGRLAQVPITANAIRADGVIVKAVAVGTWGGAAILHLDTGKVEPVMLRPGYPLAF